MEILLSQRSKRNAMDTIRRLTLRIWGGTLESCILRINAWLAGWHQPFGIVAPEEEWTLRPLDAHIRRRLRAIVVHHWRRKRTIACNLVKLGVKQRNAWRQGYAGRKSLWALSHTHPVDQGMNTRFFQARGLIALVGLHRHRHQHIAAPIEAQMALWG